MRPTEALAIAAVVLMLIIGSCKAVRAEDRFERNFIKFHSTYSWEKRTDAEVRRLARAIYLGCREDYNLAAYCAVIGALETNYTRKAPGVRYTKTRGYLGTHNRVLFAECRRLDLPRAQGLLDWWEKHPTEATWLGASRWHYIATTYKDIPTALKQWVQGDNWRRDPCARKKAEQYLSGAVRLRSENF